MTQTLKAVGMMLIVQMQNIVLTSATTFDSVDKDLHNKALMLASRHTWYPLKRYMLEDSLGCLAKANAVKTD